MNAPFHARSENEPKAPSTFAVETLVVEWSILSFIDLSALKIEASATRSKKINKTNKEYSFSRS